MSTAPTTIPASPFSCEARMKALFMQAPAAIAILEGPQFIFSFVNPLFESLFGRQQQELLGQPLRKVYPELEGQGVFELLMGVFDSGEAYHGREFPGRLFHQQTLRTGYYDFVAQPIRDAGGQVSDIMIHAVEVTERVLARKKIEESEQRFQNMVSSSPFAISIFKGSAFIVSVANDTCLDFFGQTRESMIGRSLYSIMPEVLAQGFGTILYQVMDTGQPYLGSQVPIIINRKGKTETRYCDFVYQAVRDSDGKIDGVAVIAYEVTPVALLHQRIRENEKQLKELANAMPQVVWIADSEGKVTYYNNRVEEFAGAIQYEDGTWSWEGVLHPDDLPATVQAWEAAVSKGLPAYEIAHRIKMKDGNFHWHLSRAFPQKNEQGEIVKWFGTATDIHAQKIGEMKVKESEERFKQLADMMPQMVWTAQPDGQTDYYNKRWYEYTGYEESYGDQSWMPLIHPEDLDRTVEAWNKALTTATLYEVEYRLKDRTRPGHYRWFLGRSLPVRDCQGKIVKWFGTCTDIDDQKNFSEKLESLVAARTAELQHEKEFIEAVLNSSNDAIAVFDKEMKYILGNSRMEQQFNLQKDRYTNRSLLEVFPHLLQSEFQQDLTRCLQGDSFMKEAYRSLVADKWLQNYFVPLRESDGSIYGAMVVGHDITDVMEATEKVRWANEALQQKNAELERTNNELESFNYIASHDLQEPLRKIQTFIDLLQQAEGEEEANRYFGKIRQSAKRMSELIRSVLSYSRLSDRNEERTTVDLNTVMEEVIQDFELMIAEKQAVVDYPQLPKMEGIPFQLKQLFHNLISNSLKFCPQNPVIRIRYEMAGPGILPDKDREYLYIKLSDNGIGFEQQFSEQIFQLFQRLHSRDQFAGTGIGLSIVKKIVENHKGLISAEGEPGNGSTFHIWLPA